MTLIESNKYLRDEKIRNEIIHSHAKASFEIENIRYKFLIILVYYQRPTMVLNALESIKRLDYDNWELVFIDDGSVDKGEPIVREYLKDYLDKIKFYYIDDSIEKKKEQNGSRHGQYLNEAILQSDADYIITLCDDDALISDYLTNLYYFFIDNPDVKYCHSNVIVYNPLVENPFEKEKTEHWVNRTGDIIPVCAVDSSQVAIKTSCFKEDNIQYPFPQTRDLDAVLFHQLYNRYGLCKFTGFDSQYKAYFQDQLGARQVVNDFKVDFK